jgi:non-ribosomal peptide synthetase component F
VDLKLEQRLNWLSRTNGTTLFVVWLAALVALLAAETGRRDIIIGTNMTSRRRHPALRNMIGCFANLVALRFQFDPETPFNNWLFEVRSSVTAAQEHCEIPHKELKNMLRDLGVAPPELQVVFIAPVGTGRVDMQFAGLEFCELDLYTGSRMPWGLTIDLRKRQLQICRAYFDAGIYDPVGVRRFLGRLCKLLDAFAQYPDVPIGDLWARLDLGHERPPHRREV